MLQNYCNIPDQFKFEFEIDGAAEQMIILTIFNFHYNLNNLKDYSTNVVKIKKEGNENNELENDTFLNFAIYDHKIIQSEQNLMETKKNFKHCLNFLKEFINHFTLNFNEDNIAFVEKIVIITFYWFSINSDVYNIVIDDKIKRELKFLNYLIQESPEIKEFRKDKSSFIKKIEIINTMILPIETSFYVSLFF